VYARQVFAILSSEAGGLKPTLQIAGSPKVELKSLSSFSFDKSADLDVHNFFIFHKMRLDNSSLLQMAHLILIYVSLLKDDVTGVEFVIFLDGVVEMQEVPFGHVLIIQYVFPDLISVSMFQRGSKQCIGEPCLSLKVSGYWMKSGEGVCL
jgi:hypothetical protein